MWKDRTALERLAGDAKVSELSPQIIVVLGRLLRVRDADVMSLLTAAQRRYPSDFWLNYDLGAALHHAKRWQEAIGYYRAALALHPAASVVYSNLGLALREIRRVDEAIARVPEGCRTRPQECHAHTNLGNALGDKGQCGRGHRQHTGRPSNSTRSTPLSHNNLGNALRAKGQ